MHPGGQSLDHLRPLEDVDASAEERRTRRVEGVRRHVISVGPDADVRIVDEVHGVGHEVVEVVGPGRVLRFRDRDALVRVARSRSHDKLGEDPASGENVVSDDRIAVVVTRARAAQRLEQRVAGGGAVEQRTRGLVEDREAGVVPLNVLRRADAAVHVGGVAVRQEAGETHSDAVPTHARRRRRGRRRARRQLHRRNIRGLVVDRAIDEDRFRMLGHRGRPPRDRPDVAQRLAANRRHRDRGVFDRFRLGFLRWGRCGRRRRLSARWLVGLSERCVDPHYIDKKSQSKKHTEAKPRITALHS